MLEKSETNALNFKEVYFSFMCLSVYRGLLSEAVAGKLFRLVKYISGDKACMDGFIKLYCGFYHELIKHNSKGSLKRYLAEQMLYDENPFTRAAENSGFSGMDKNIIHAASKDLGFLSTICRVSSGSVKSCAKKSICGSDYELKLVDMLPDWDYPDGAGHKEPEALSPAESLIQLFLSADNWDGHIEKLAEFHNLNGTGVFLKYKAFVWERSDGAGRFRGVENPDPVNLSDLIGYEDERSEVIDNTKQFLKGYFANNVLLYGDRGTGKSSTVKAVLNEYYGYGLRIVEVPKVHLVDFPEIIRELKGRKQKFIIFVDDLVFGDNEESYTALKAILEGGLENRPQNVLIYATSNRRHLIKEKFSDREGLKSGNADDEIRAADTIQEKLSLADRFGITVVFSSPDKKGYLDIVEGIAVRRGMAIDRESLHKEALKWELWYNGRSPRTARQFIDWLEGQSRGLEP